MKRSVCKAHRLLVANDKKKNWYFNTASLLLFLVLCRTLTLAFKELNSQPNRSWLSAVRCAVKSITVSKGIHKRSCTARSSIQNNNNTVRVAVVFYGLPRGLAITAPSIFQNILLPLKQARVSYVTYFHHVVFSGVYSNPRNREANLILISTEWALLEPDVASSTEHDEFLAENTDLINKVLSFGDPHENDGLSTKNEMEALHCLKRAVQVAEADSQRFDGMLILRPDLLYHDVLDVHGLLWSIRHGAVVTPAWQLGGGVNDRFAFGAWEPVIALGKRYDRILEYCIENQEPWHPEIFVGWVLEKHSMEMTSQPDGVCHCHTAQRASRVRAHGHIKTENFCMPSQYFMHCN